MKQKKKVSHLEHLSIRVTRWMGSTQSLVVHTILFGIIFLLQFVGLSLDQIMLILTTAVSLEAIYLSLFIQMTVNRTTKSLENVEEDIEEIQQDVEDVQENVAGLEDNVEDISEDIDKMYADEKAEEKKEEESDKTLDDIETNLTKLMADIKYLKENIKATRSV